MISNLLVMVIVGGYETFVSRLRLGGIRISRDGGPTSMRKMPKVKLAIAIIGISFMHLAAGGASEAVAREPG